MSKGYGETMALLEFMSKLMNKPEPEKKPKRRKYRIDREDFDMRYVDATTLIHKEIEKAENLIKFLKDYEKANKKEDKKPDDKGWSANQISTLLVATFPLAVLMSAAALHILFK